MKKPFSLLPVSISILIASHVYAVEFYEPMTIETPLIPASCSVVAPSIDFGDFGVLDLGDPDMAKDVTLPIICTGEVTPTGLTMSTVANHAKGYYPSSVPGMSYKIVKKGALLGIADAVELKNKTNLLSSIPAASRVLTVGTNNVVMTILPMADMALTDIVPNSSISDNINITLTY